VAVTLLSSVAVDPVVDTDGKPRPNSSPFRSCSVDAVAMPHGADRQRLVVPVRCAYLPALRGRLQLRGGSLTTVNPDAALVGLLSTSVFDLSVAGQVVGRVRVLPAAIYPIATADLIGGVETRGIESADDAVEPFGHFYNGSVAGPEEDVRTEPGMFVTNGSDATRCRRERASGLQWLAAE
jgi:hypothetical protein